MSIYDLLPTKKVTAYLLGGALTVAGFWILIEVGTLDDWPEAWVLAAFTIIIGFIVAWLVPGSAWKKAGEHLRGTVGDDTEVEGDVTLTSTGVGTADIEGEVSVDENENLA